MQKQEVELTEYVNPQQLLAIVQGIIEKAKITSMVRTTILNGRDISGIYIIIYEKY